MRVPWMIMIWSQSIAKSSATGTEALNNITVNQQIKNAIDRHPVDLAPLLQNFMNVVSRQRGAVITDDLQDIDPIVCHFQLGLGQ